MTYEDDSAREPDETDDYAWCGIACPHDPPCDTAQPSAATTARAT